MRQRFIEMEKSQTAIQTGIAESEIIESGSTEKTGTQMVLARLLTLVDQVFEYEIIDKRLRELAYLNRN